MDFWGDYGYGDAGNGMVWALVARKSDSDTKHIPKLPDGQWWVIGITVHRGELLNCSIECDSLRVVRCRPTQQVNTVVKLDRHQMTVVKTVKNHNKKKRR